MDNNILTFGFEKAHYAPYIEGEAGAVGTWDTPKPLAPAVSLSLKASGDNASFFADNRSIFNQTQDNGFTGDLTVSKFPNEFLIAALSWVVDKNKMLVETANVAQKPFALLFEIMGTGSPIRVVVYNCTGSKPTKDIQTNEASPKLTGEIMSITASTMSFGWVTTAKASLTREENPDAFDKFFDKVLLPIKPTETPETP